MSPPQDRSAAGPQRLFDTLRDLGIETRTLEHAPMYTVEEAKAQRGALPGGHTKNLFLRDKKGRMWLVVCQEDRPIDLKRLSVLLGGGRLSFGSPDRLMRHLGVIPGAVTPFAAINDRDGAVEVVLDAALMRLDPLNFHPLDNTRTTAIAPGDLLRFLESTGHPPRLLDLDSAAEGA